MAAEERSLEVAPESTQAVAKPGTDARRLDQIISGQLSTLRSYQLAVIETAEADPVHKMRVTTRRLQASLDLLEWNPDELKVRKLKKRIRKWRRALSRVRNYDVFLEVLEREKRRRRRALDPPGYGALSQTLRDKRTENWNRVRPGLERVDVGLIASALSISVESDDMPDGQAAMDAPEVLDEQRITLRAAERIEQRLSEFLSLASQSHPEAAPAELHRLRIGAKRLRYLFETTGKMGYSGASRAMNWLKRLQDNIGDWHDLEALEQEILAIVSRKKFLRTNLEVSSEMLQVAVRHRKKKEALARKLFPLSTPMFIESAARRVARRLRTRSAALARRNNGSKD